MSITLDLDEKALAVLPLQPGERERLMQIELACRFYAKGWLDGRTTDYKSGKRRLRAEAQSAQRRKFSYDCVCEAPFWPVQARLYAFEDQQIGALIPDFVSALSAPLREK